MTEYLLECSCHSQNGPPISATLITHGRNPEPPLSSHNIFTATLNLDYFNPAAYHSHPLIQGLP